MALSQREKHVVIGGALLLVGLLFYVFVVSPMLDDYSKLSVDLPNKERELRETRELAAQYEDLIEVKEKLQDQVDEDRKGMLRKETLVKSQNALIELLNGFADQAEILVTTQDPMPPEEKDPFAEIKVRFDVEGRTEALREFLQSIENSSVLLGVEKMRIASSRDKKKLEVSMEIAALATEPREGEMMAEVTSVRDVDVQGVEVPGMERAKPPVGPREAGEVPAPPGVGVPPASEKDQKLREMGPDYLPFLSDRTRKRSGVMPKKTETNGSEHDGP